MAFNKTEQKQPQRPHLLSFCPLPSPAPLPRHPPSPAQAVTSPVTASSSYRNKDSAQGGRGNPSGRRAINESPGAPRGPPRPPRLPALLLPAATGADPSWKRPLAPGSGGPGPGEPSPAQGTRPRPLRAARATHHVGGARGPRGGGGAPARPRARPARGVRGAACTAAPAPGFCRVGRSPAAEQRWLARCLPRAPHEDPSCLAQNSSAQMTLPPAPWALAPYCFAPARWEEAARAASQP